MKQVLILGIGNLLWSDEGYGVRTIEALHHQYRFDPSVTVMDGGTQGMALYPYIMASSHILVFDAIQFHLEPGTLKVIRDAEVPIHCSTKISPHQTTFSEVLAHAALLDSLPEKITVIGVQPDVLSDFGGSLTQKVHAKIPESIRLAISELESWGVEVHQRDAGEKVEPLNAQALILSSYEGERPSAQDACRVGDARFLYQKET